MRCIKKNAIFRVLSIITIIAFINTDAPWTRLCDNTPETTNLAAQSAFQERVMTDGALRFQRSLFSDICLTNSLLSIGRFLLGDPDDPSVKPQPLRFLQPVLGYELRHISAGMDLENGVSMDASGAVRVRYVDVRDKEHTILVALKDALSPRELAGFKWLVFEKYAMKEVIDGEAADDSVPALPEMTDAPVFTPPVAEMPFRTPGPWSESAFYVREIVCSAFLIFLTPIVLLAAGRSGFRGWSGLQGLAGQMPVLFGYANSNTMLMAVCVIAAMAVVMHYRVGIYRLIFAVINHSYERKLFLRVKLGDVAAVYPFLESAAPVRLLKGLFRTRRWRQDKGSDILRVIIWIAGAGDADVSRRAMRFLLDIRRSVPDVDRMTDEMVKQNHRLAGPLFELITADRDLLVKRWVSISWGLLDIAMDRGHPRSREAFDILQSLCREVDGGEMFLFSNLMHEGPDNEILFELMFYDGPRMRDFNAAWIAEFSGRLVPVMARIIKDRSSSSRERAVLVLEKIGLPLEMEIVGACTEVLLDPGEAPDFKSSVFRLLNKLALSDACRPLCKVLDLYSRNGHRDPVMCEKTTRLLVDIVKGKDKRSREWKLVKHQVLRLLGHELSAFRAIGFDAVQAMGITRLYEQDMPGYYIAARDWNALACLGAVAYPLMDKILRHDTDEEALMGIVRCLAGSTDSHAAELLITAAGHARNAGVRQEARRVLGTMPYPDVREASAVLDRGGVPVEPARPDRDTARAMLDAMNDIVEYFTDNPLSTVDMAKFSALTHINENGSYAEIACAVTSLLDEIARVRAMGQDGWFRELSVPDPIAAKIDFLQRTVKVFKAESVKTMLMILARKAKRDGQRLIIGIETDWIPGYRERGLGYNALYPLMHTVDSLGRYLAGLGLDVDIVHESSDALAGAVLARAEETCTDLKNVVVLAADKTICSASFAPLRSVPGIRRAFLAGVKPDAIERCCRAAPDGQGSVYIPLIDMLLIALELAADKEPPHAPMVAMYNRSLRVVVFLPGAEPEDYDVMEREYRSEALALRSV